MQCVNRTHQEHRRVYAREAQFVCVVVMFVAVAG